MAGAKINKKKIVRKLSRKARIPAGRIETSGKEKQKRKRWKAWQKELQKLRDEDPAD